MNASQNADHAKHRCAELLAENEAILARCGDGMGDADFAQVQANFDAFMRLQPGPVLAERSDLIALLREAGLPRGAAERVAAGGWPELRPGVAAAEAADRIRRASARLKPN